jgi:hypothetical protein
MYRMVFEERMMSSSVVVSRGVAIERSKKKQIKDGVIYV